MEQLGPYRIESELSRGGMGVVYLAWDSSAERRVALKRVLQANKPGRLARFHREARLLAKLDHPNIVRVHELGGDHDQPFMVMDFVEGKTLRELLDETGSLEPRRAVQIALALSSALQHAHGRGVLHRDLKPDNVLLTEGGVPVLIDFGLTRDVESGSLTSSGAALGTPGFWAPEQAYGDPAKVGPRSDVFGLGALLYTLLVGEEPFVGENLPAQVLGMESGAPTIEVDLGLNSVCQRCMAFEPEDRYASAAEVSADLQRWLAGERPLAHVEPVSRVGAGAAGAVGLLLLLGGGITLTASWVSEPDQGEIAETPSPSPVPDEVPESRPEPGPEPEAPLAVDPSSLDWWSLTPFEGAPDEAELRAAWRELAKNRTARARLDAHVRKHPTDAEGLLWRAVANVRAEEYEAARRDAEHVSELRPSDCRPHVVLRHIAIRLLDLEGAQREQTLSERKVSGAYGPRGELLHVLGDSARAANDYLRALEAAPDDMRLNALHAAAIASTDRARALTLLAKVDRQLEESGLPLPYDPLPAFWSKKLLRAYVDSRLEIVESTHAAGKIEEAIQLLRRMLVNHPKEYRAHFRLSKTLFDDRRYEKALEASRCWTERGGDARALYYAGKSLRRLDRHDEAIETLTEALERGHDVSRKERGETYYLLERYDLCLADLDAFLRVNPEHVSAMVTRALCAAQLGRVDEARQALVLFETDERFKNHSVWISQLQRLLRDQ